MKEVEKSQKQEEVNQISMMEQPSPREQRVYSLLLPFAGSKSTTIAKNLNKTFKNILPNNVKTGITYTGQKLRSRFQMKDKTYKLIKNINTILNHPVPKKMLVKQVAEL